MEEIDLRIWDYIDDRCSAEEQALIGKLILSDKTWKEKYNTFMEFRQNLERGLEMEEPSMRFDQNVMDQIAVSTIALPAKKYINKWVIRGVGILFILPIAILLIYALANVNWSSGSAGYSFNTSFADRLSDLRAWNIVIMINVLLVLLMADALVRRRKAQFRS